MKERDRVEGEEEEEVMRGENYKTKRKEKEEKEEKHDIISELHYFVTEGLLLIVHVNRTTDKCAI